MKNSITIFGGTGDLAFRKLIPALYNLEYLCSLEDNFCIIIIGRRDYSIDEYLKIAKSWVQENAKRKFEEEIWNRLSDRILYYKMNISEKAEFEGLSKFYKDQNIVKNIYYYSVAPQLFNIISEGIIEYCDTKNSKVIIEKPFGVDLESAKKLNELLKKNFDNDNIFYIDHYIGKEMIQNIKALRFSNIIFNKIWNKENIENIQITASEELGVGSRAGYYDKSGALKDMIQNHLLQLLSILTMSNEEKDSDPQLEILKSIKLKRKEDIVIGQYEGYTEESNISKDSETETFVAMKIEIDNDLWRGVPIFIRTGKKLASRETKVIIKFKKQGDNPSNLLIIKIQPEEGVYLQINGKKPGNTYDIHQVSMDFCQSCILENRINTPEAYERLILASIRDDNSLFTKWEHIVHSWQFINDVLKKSEGRMFKYKQGSTGPIEIYDLVDWMD